MAEPKVATTRVDQRPFAEILKESGFTKKVDGKTVGSFNAFEKHLKKIDKNLTVFSNDPRMMNKVTAELNKVRKAKDLKPYTNVGVSTARSIFENIYTKSKGFEGLYGEAFSKAEKDKFTKIQLDVQKDADKKFGKKEDLNKTQANKKLTYMANQIKQKIGSKAALRLGLSVPVIKLLLTKSLYGTPLAPLAAASDAAFLAENLAPVAEEAAEQVSEKVIEPAAEKMVQGENILTDFLMSKLKMRGGGMANIFDMTRPVGYANGGFANRMEMLRETMRDDVNKTMRAPDVTNVALRIAREQGNTSEDNINLIIKQLEALVPSLMQNMETELTDPVTRGINTIRDKVLQRMGKKSSPAQNRSVGFGRVE
jgi:hypothetical protein